MSKLNLTCCLAVLLLLGGVALLIWSRAAAMSPGGGSTAEAGPFETTPVLTFPETAAAPALQGLAREAEVSPPEARDPLQIDSPSATADGTQAIAGEVLLVAADGTAEPIREGTLHLRPEGKGESSEREVPVRDGHFTARVPKSHEPQFRTVAFGGQVAIVFEADRPELDPVDGRFTVKARVFPDTVIHVLDASTGEELPQVFLQAASHPNGAFPHPGLLSPSLPAAVASPIRYPATFERIDRSQIVYRIGAPNHAWASLPIKPRAGREYTVKLVAGGSLTLTVTGPSLPRQARVRIRRVRGRRPVASYLVPQGGVISCEGLAPERYMARLEVGEWFDDPILLGQVQFEILAGRRSEARLEYRALAIPKSVPLAGIVHVPEGWPIAKLQMTIELLDTPLLGRAHANFTIGSGLEPVVGQPRRFRFDAGQWQAGRYQLSFRPYRYHIGLHLGEAGEPDVRVEVPARVKVRVEIEGDIGGRTSHVESLHWHCVVPKGVSMWAWHAVKRSGPKAVFEFEAPATPIMVSVGERTYYAEPLRIDVKDTGGQATLRVQPTCLLWIRAMVGEKQVGWKEDWPMRVVGLMPEGKRLTRGRESGRHFCDLSRPGRYRISLGPIPGYAPIPDLEVEVGLREPTEIRIDLQPLR